METEIKQLERGGEVGKLAGQLLRQCCYQQELLQAAVNEIARLELQLM